MLRCNQLIVAGPETTGVRVSTAPQYEITKRRGPTQRNAGTATCMTELTVGRRVPVGAPLRQPLRLNID